MQKFFLSEEFQDQFNCQPRHSKEADLRKPSPEVIQTLLAYAAALRVVKTKTLGDINILIN
jgi:hypothetical protein